jgi:hypothetical protein
MGGGGGSQSSTTTTELSPDFKPYVQYALGQAKSIYEQPSGIPEQLYVDPSQATQSALQMAQDRAMAGSPLVQAAQQEQLDTIQGRGVNPFLEGALAGVNRQAGDAYTRNIQNLQSQASSMGRYGSAAQGQQQMSAQDVFARALAEQAGQLAYGSAEAERARQMQAVGAAPQMAAADYADIQRLLQVGQGREAYDQARIQGQMAAADVPFNRLQRATNIFYGAPLETTTEQTATPSGGK